MTAGYGHRNGLKELSILSFPPKQPGGSDWGCPFWQMPPGQPTAILHLESEPGKGTKVKATFQASHIDMKPLGDMRTDADDTHHGSPRNGYPVLAQTQS